MYNKEQFINMQQKYGSGKNNTVFSSVISLINKLEEKEIQDEELNDLLDGLYYAYERITTGDKTARKQASKAYSKIVSYAKEKYNLAQKGTIQGMYLAIFIGAGVAFGAAFSTINSGLIGAGIAIGVSIGIAVGTSMENKAKQEGRLY